MEENSVVAFRMMTPEEKEKHAREKKRKELLERLERASTQKHDKPKIDRSTIERPGMNKEEEDIKFPKEKEDSIADIFEKAKSNPVFDDFDWGEIEDRAYDQSVDDIDLSPTDRATNDNILGFWDRREEEEEPYQNLFKDEIAMMSEVLKELKEQTKLVSSRIKAMSGNRAGGVSKTYSDLISAASTMQSTRLNAISKIADLKAKREDFKLKRKKDEGPAVDTDASAIVDQWYSRFVTGDRREYDHQAMASMAPEGMQLDESQSETEYQRYNISDGFAYDDSGADDVDGDPYGYIKHEGDGVEVCVQRYSDGSIEFVALDQNGNYVEDYELPSKEVLDGVTIAPMSHYANDMVGRKYRVIDFNPDQDLSDIDDDKYN